MKKTIVSLFLIILLVGTMCGVSQADITAGTYNLDSNGTLVHMTSLPDGSLAVGDVLEAIGVHTSSSNAVRTSLNYGPWVIDPNNPNNMSRTFKTTRSEEIYEFKGTLFNEPPGNSYFGTSEYFCYGRQYMTRVDENSVWEFVKTTGTVNRRGKFDDYPFSWTATGKFTFLLAHISYSPDSDYRYVDFPMSSESVTIYANSNPEHPIIPGTYCSPAGNGSLVHVTSLPDGSFGVGDVAEATGVHTSLSNAVRSSIDYGPWEIDPNDPNNMSRTTNSSRSGEIYEFKGTLFNEPQGNSYFGTSESLSYGRQYMTRADENSPWVWVKTTGTVHRWGTFDSHPFSWTATGEYTLLPVHLSESPDSDYRYFDFRMSSGCLTITANLTQGGAQVIDLVPENFWGNVGFEMPDGTFQDPPLSESATFENGVIHLDLTVPTGVWGFLNISPIDYSSFDSNDDFIIKVSFENFNFVLSGENDSAGDHKVRLGACSENVLSALDLLGNDFYESWLWPVSNPEPGFFMPAGGITSGTFVYKKIGTTVIMSFENVPGAEWIYENVEWNQEIDHGIQINAYGGGETSVDITKYEVELLKNNSKPILEQIGNKIGNEGELLEFTITATDPDVGDELTFSADNLPEGATFDPATATFSWTPAFNQEGNYQDIIFSVADNGNPIETDVEAITITIGNVNRPPIFEPIPIISANEGELVEFEVLSGT